MSGLGRWLAVGGVLALVAATVPWWRGRADRLLLLGAVLLGAATLVLAVALVRMDPTLAYVAGHARRGDDWWWRLAGLWGGTEGSLLLFATTMAAVGAVATRRDRVGRPPADTTLVVPLVAGLAAGVAGVSMVTADPFAVLAVPSLDGTGLVPILQHWAMLVHPPLTYLGLAYLVVPGARGLDLLWRGVPAGGDAPGVVLLRRDLRVAWVLLAGGMWLGSRWAYVELGWGGWWAWDAVENTSLVPWLAVTAALHVVGAPGRARVAAILAVVALVLGLAGSTLTRSGAASSVHAFAEAVDVGWGLGLLTVVVALGAAMVVARAASRTPADEGGARGADLRTWAVAVLAAVCAIVAVGSLVPLARRAVGEGPSTTSPTFFAEWTTPLAWALLVGLSVQALGGGVGGRGHRWSTVAVVVVGGGSAALVATWAGATLVGLVTAALAGVAVTATVGAGVQRGLASNVVSVLAHLGVGLLLLGAAAGTGSTTATVPLAASEEALVHGVVVTNVGAFVEPTSPEDQPIVVVPVTVRRAGTGASLRPSVVAYPDIGVRVAETATWSTWRGDVQVAVSRASDDGRAVLIVHQRPLVWLVWLGGALVVAAGALALVRTGARRGLWRSGVVAVDAG